MSAPTSDFYEAFDQALAPEVTRQTLAKRCVLDAAKWRDIHQHTVRKGGDIWKTSETIDMVDKAMKDSKSTLADIRTMLESISFKEIPASGTSIEGYTNLTKDEKSKLDNGTQTMWLTKEGKSAVFGLYDWALSENLISVDHVFEDLGEIRTLCTGRPQFVGPKGFPPLLERCSCALAAQSFETEDVIRLLLKTALASEFPKYAGGLSTWRVLEA